MKNLMIDAIGIAGFGSMTTGIWLQFGPDPAMIVCGAIALVLALAAAGRGSK